MAASIAAVAALVIFWVVVFGVRLLLGDSLVDPLAAVVASIAVPVLVYRAVLRRRT